MLSPACLAPPRAPQATAALAKASAACKTLRPCCQASPVRASCLLALQVPHKSHARRVPACRRRLRLAPPHAAASAEPAVGAQQPHGEHRSKRGLLGMLAPFSDPVANAKLLALCTCEAGRLGGPQPSRRAGCSAKPRPAASGRLLTRPCCLARAGRSVAAPPSCLLLAPASPLCSPDAGLCGHPHHGDLPAALSLRGAPPEPHAGGWDMPVTWAAPVRVGRGRVGRAGGEGGTVHGAAKPSLILASPNHRAALSPPPADRKPAGQRAAACQAVRRPVRLGSRHCFPCPHGAARHGAQVGADEGGWVGGCPGGSVQL